MDNKLVNGKSVVNPDESLAELYNQRRKLSNALSTTDDKNKVYHAIEICNRKIGDAEKAMSNGGIVRLF